MAGELTFPGGQLCEIVSKTRNIMMAGHSGSAALPREVKPVMRTSALEEFAQAYEVLRRFIRRHELVEGNAGLSRVQAMIVRYLYAHGDRTVGQVAEYLAVRPSTMSQMIDRLQLAGLVDRVADEHDARIRLVHLTSAGEAMVTQLRNVRLTLLHEPFGKLAEDEQIVVAQLLTKLARELPDTPDEF